MTPRIVIAGASGLIGRAVVASYRAEGARVVTVGRGSTSDVSWSAGEELAAAIDGAEVVINLAGRSVHCRYTPTNRAEILRSRVETTAAIGTAIRRAARPPRLWMNASSATLYRHEVYVPHTEDAGVEGDGYSSAVVRAWEAALFRDELPHTRRVALRTSIVLASEGALPVLSRLVRLGLGGPQGDGAWPRSAQRERAGIDHHYGTRGGRQKFSWIHLDDVVGAMRFIDTAAQLQGAVNLSAPMATDNRGLMAALRRVHGVSVGLSPPRWLLEAGAWLLRTETELLLKSRWIRPEKLIDAGYDFRFDDVEDAVQSALSPATMDS